MNEEWEMLNRIREIIHSWRVRKIDDDELIMAPVWDEYPFTGISWVEEREDAEWFIALPDDLKRDLRTWASLWFELHGMMNSTALMVSWRWRSGSGGSPRGSARRFIPRSIWLFAVEGVGGVGASLAG